MFLGRVLHGPTVHLAIAGAALVYDDDPADDHNAWAHEISLDIGPRTLCNKSWIASADVLWFNKPQFDKPRFDKPRLTAELAQNLYTRNPSFDTDLRTCLNNSSIESSTCWP
mmetsp:Transcript_165775/g.526985  ORF Transcript_165775/g.526985 Transcript_165775/m.526985 type:complete len:112 (-) Transcript_165775:698-1033(-)